MNRLSSHSDTSPSSWLLASRRDTLLLLLLAGGVVAWTWERGTLAALGGGLVCGILFILLLLLLRQSQVAARAMQSTTPDNELLVWSIHSLTWPICVMLVGALPAALLVGRAAWQGLGSNLLTIITGLLTWSWQIWLFFWTAEPTDTLHEEQH